MPPSPNSGQPVGDYAGQRHPFSPEVVLMYRSIKMITTLVKQMVRPKILWNPTMKELQVKKKAPVKTPKPKFVVLNKD